MTQWHYIAEWLNDITPILIAPLNNLINIGQIMPKHVKEAYRLLNKSIIRVDQPDIHLVSQLKTFFS
jgi:hypothetical protein